MADWLMVIVLTLMAGLAMPLGAAIAAIERIGPEWLENELRHTIIAFGGGALLSAVALVLVPEGQAELSPGLVAVCFAFGGIVFMGLDLLLDSLQSRASQLAAMLSDFIPEALALGAALASGSQAALLLALLMSLQNIPEGFNACRELMQDTSYRSDQIIRALVLMALCGPVAGLSGYFWLAGSPQVLAAIMLFAAGGILYLVFQDIAPQARLERHWGPPLGAVAGFLLGVLGEMAIVG